MGSVGDSYDNSMAESFFATLECELIDRTTFRSHAEAEMAIFEFIEGFSNPRRRHSSIDYLSPMAYEKKHAEAASYAGRVSGPDEMPSIRVLREEIPRGRSTIPMPISKRTGRSSSSQKRR